MRIMRVGEVGAEIPVVIANDGVARDLRSLVDDIFPTFFASGTLSTIQDAIAHGSLSPIDITGQRIGSPMASTGSIICIGMNYAAHAAESGSAPPEEPVVFFKKSNSLSGPNDPVPLPRGSRRLDWEVELGIVVGEPGFGSLDSVAPGLECVAGYVLADDLSEREWQIERSGGQWSKGKSGQKFAPLGPWIACADEVADPQELCLRSWVNGQSRQDSNTRDMIFSVAQIIADLALYMDLEPGDIILTGTPEGVALSGRFPYLAEGDSVALEIDGLGRQEHIITKSERGEA